ncbi:hypothetical protein ID866_11828 [Astraeus odoratus]|nr:hypothetical protein ID866_11828 [Astraeus odoratus]
MSSPRRTSSPHERCLAKTKAPKERMEEEWRLISEGELDPVSSDDEKTAEMRDQEKKWRVEEKVERRAKEEVERWAKEDTEREDAAWRATEAAEERADAERRALEERLWEAAGQQSAMAVAPPWVAKSSRQMTMAGPSVTGRRASGVQDPCTRCHNKGTPCVLGTAKGKTMACEACHHAKETEDTEVVDVDKDEDEERPHFAVLQHLAEEHRDALGALTTTLDTLSMDFLEFWRDSWNLGVAMLQAIESVADELRRANNLKEEEMGRGKGKGKEKEEGPKRRMEDDDGDMEMGRAGPSSLV